MNETTNCSLLSAFTIAGGSLSALNSGEGYGNVVTLKRYTSNGHAYPYVSGQAIRFALRNSIREQVKNNGACIYDEDGHSCGRPATCVLCDLMGFMRAEGKPPTEKGLAKEISDLEKKINDLVEKQKSKAGKEKTPGSKSNEQIELETQKALLEAAIPDARRREALSKAIKEKRKQVKDALAKPGTLSEGRINELRREIDAQLYELDQLNPRDKRQSPLQVSPLMGLVPLEDSLVTDFLTSEKPGTMDKAIANIEASKNVYYGAWAVDLKRVGAYDLLDPVAQTITWKPIYSANGQVDTNIRNQRVRYLLKAFQHLTGFAKQARMMDSLEADAVVFCLSPVYSHLLIKLAHGLTASNGDIAVNEDLWKSVLKDCRTQGASFSVGLREGLMKDASKFREQFNKDELKGSPHEAFAAVVEQFHVAGVGT